MRAWGEFTLPPRFYIVGGESMKVLELKEISLVNGETHTYSFLIPQVLNSPPKDGFSLDQMRKRMKIIETLDNSEKTLELEDSEAKELQAATARMPWAFMHADLVRFADDVKDMKAI